MNVMDSNELRQAIGENVKCRRKELGFTQQQLAEMVGCTQAKIAQIESAIRPMPSDELASFAESLHTTPAALVTPHSFSKIPVRQA